MIVDALLAFPSKQKQQAKHVVIGYLTFIQQSRARVITLKNAIKRAGIISGYARHVLFMFATMCSGRTHDWHCCGLGEPPWEGDKCSVSWTDL